MSKYVYLYTGGGMAETPEAQAQIMQAWTAWFGELGEAVLDGGNPFGASAAVEGGRGRQQRLVVRDRRLHPDQRRFPGRRNRSRQGLPAVDRRWHGRDLRGHLRCAADIGTGVDR